ncbi:aromatic acid exporter family protein [Bacillus testis]|uniref:aromatic acid exporter family protein n=1 Tax=Bacillus testis TaxID=1622072 RepID=UPI00067F6C2A|nr:aromatic acid exporter family protein [Bacillus testis]
MFRIGYRTIKTAIGVAIAISIAQLCHLNSFPSAGIITILCIQITKKKSLQAAFSRFLACLIAMLYSTIFFEGIAFHPAVIGLMLLFFIPTVVAVKAQEGVVTSSVILLHIYSAGHVTVHLLLNELGLLVIGITVALLMNLYMPSVEGKLKKARQQLEGDFSVIFKKMALYLRTNRSNWDGEELMRVNDTISEAKILAFRDVENHVTSKDDLYYQYFIMREKQFEIVERMLPLAAVLPKELPYSQVLADFIEELADHVHPYNTSHIYLRKLDALMEQAQQMPLPATREEFDIQAALIGLIKELEKYLILKSIYKGFSRQKGCMKKEAVT